MDKNIPTAEEYIWKYGNRETSRKDLMIAFAKLHVEAALREAVKNAWVVDGCDTHGVEIDEDTILKAYPLTNIK